MKNSKLLILKAFQKNGSLKMAELIETIKMSRQAIHRHLQALITEGKILKYGGSRRDTSYILNDPSVHKNVWGKFRKFHKKIKTKNLTEDGLLSDVETEPGLLGNLSANALKNFRYAFTEMVNNAIDHSQSTFVEVDVAVDKGNVSFRVSDKGIGIFENILTKKKLANELEAIQDILKGKQTTMPKKHSGEGIFFTSKIADRFVIESHNKKVIIDNRIDDVFVEDIRFTKGTRVLFESASDTKKQLFDLFKMYTNENYQFDKTHVRVKLFEGEDLYISRSQAKRILHSMETFGEITLNFEDVKTVGQAFADEVFRVFQGEHPNIKISAINCNENVDFMIKRAKV